MKDKHPGIKNISQAIKERIAKAHTDNVSIYMPGLEEPELGEFRKRFKDVRIEPFGCVRFEVKE